MQRSTYTNCVRKTGISIVSIIVVIFILTMSVLIVSKSYNIELAYGQELFNSTEFNNDDNPSTSNSSDGADNNQQYSEPSITVSTDKSEYQTGDTVKISGELDGVQRYRAPIYIRISDPNNNEYVTGEADLNTDDGSFEYTAENVNGDSGQYKVEAAYKSLNAETTFNLAGQGVSPPDDSEGGGTSTFGGGISTGGDETPPWLIIIVSIAVVAGVIGYAISKARKPRVNIEADHHYCTVQVMTQGGMEK